MNQSTVESARALIRIGDLTGARMLAEVELEQAGDDHTSEVWRLRFIRAQVLDAVGHSDEALNYLGSFAPPDHEDSESTAALKMCLASYSGYLGRYEVAHRLFRESEALASRAGLTELLGDIHLSEAFISFRRKDYVSSDALFRSVLRISSPDRSWYFRGYGLWGVGKNLMIQEHYQEALPWLNQSLEIFEAVDARLAIAMVWSELAVCYLGLGDDQKAMDLFRKAEQVTQECGVVHNYQVVLANIGNVYLHRRDYLTAISYYRRALDLARQIKDPVSVKKWTYNINLAYARIRAAVDQTSTAHV